MIQSLYSTLSRIGTADAVRQVDTDERFALIFCDSIFENFVGKSKENVIFTQDVSYEKAKRHGVVEIDETGRITDAINRYVPEGGFITARDIQGMRYNVNDKETLDEAENNLPR